MARTLEDKVIIITGASAGIGAATAIACAEAGMHLVLCARRADRLEQVAERIRQTGRIATCVAADISEPDTSQRLLDTACERHDRFDAVFANAGYGLDIPMHAMTEQQLRDIFEVNFFAGANLLRAAACHLIDTDRPGHLLMCSSCLSRITIPDHGAYCATKAAQNHVCHAMRMELKQHGIAVSSVHPVTTRTELFDVSQARSGHDTSQPTTLDRTPRVFVQPPERVARAVVRCLRRPRAEVWTSVPTRLAAAAGVLFPRLIDLGVRFRR